MGVVDRASDWGGSEVRHAGIDPGGFIVTIPIGIAGSLVGTWLGRTIGLYQEGQSAGFIMSVVGACAAPGNLPSDQKAASEPLI